jgi:uncharacterized protein (DUF1778 family)
MSSVTQTNDERINLRLKRNAKLMLERAASFEGQCKHKALVSAGCS